MSKAVANVKNTKHSQIVVKEFSCYKKASSYLQLEPGQVLNQNKTSNNHYSNFDALQAIDRQNQSQQNNYLASESTPQGKNSVFQKGNSKEQSQEKVKIFDQNRTDNDSLESNYHTNKNCSEHNKSYSQIKGKSPISAYSNGSNCTKIIKNSNKMNKYSDNSKNFSNKSKYHFSNSINSVSSFDNHNNKQEENNWSKDKSIEKSSVLYSEYKEYLKKEKIAQVISDEFHKKLSLLNNCKEGTDKIKMKLCMHFIKALIEYDKPYSTVISEIKTIIEANNQSNLLEYQSNLNALKSEVESEKKKSEKLAEEIRLLKLQQIQISETDLSYSVEEKNKPLRKSTDFKDKKDKNIVLSKTGIIIPKLDLSAITEARKLEPIKVAPPLNKSTVSKVEYVKSTKHTLAKSKSACKTFFNNNYM